jgi:hypothetical protein
MKRIAHLSRLSGRTPQECSDALLLCEDDMGKALAFLCRPLEERTQAVEDYRREHE